MNYSRLKGGTKSCGCLRKDVAKEWADRHTTHGKSQTKLYRKYRSMISRCYDKNNKQYERYGGRGITVCDEWRNSFELFFKWAYANGYDPMKNGRYWSIDRIDNSKGYCPENCRFTTAKEQMRNRDVTKLYEYCGKTFSASEFADAFGITDKSFVYRRIKKGQSLKELYNDWIAANNIPDGHIDVTSYAAAHNVSITTVNRWINCGKLKAEKRGRKWYILAN